ncbi:pilus assembly protein TadG-related protein [Nocardioides pacificus]
MPFVAVSMTLLILVAALAVDLGQQRVLRRDMQALADVVALDLARELDGRSAQDYPGGFFDVAKEASEARNGDTLDRDPDVTVDLGVVGADGEFSVVTGAGIPTAVRVRADGAVGFSFVPGEGGASRSAVASADAGACFALGSYAAQLRAGQSPLLGPLLGGIDSGLELDVLDYRALAALDVSLAGLLEADLGAGTVLELVHLGTSVPLARFYLALADVLDSESDSVAGVELLESLAVAVGDVSLSVPVRDLLSVGTDGAAGLAATLNVLDLVTAAAFAANKANAISVPELSVDLGPLAGVAVSAHVTQAPQVGCGRKDVATASTSQVGLELTSSLLSLNLGVLSTEVRLDGVVDVAPAQGTLRDVRCDPGPGITVDVADGLLDVDLTLEVKIDAVFGLVPAISGPITVSGQTSSSGQAVIDIVDGDYDTAARVGAGSSGLPVLRADVSGLRTLGLPLGALVQELVEPLLLEQVVNPVIQTLDSALLDPLLSSLGVQISGADVFARPTPSCGVPALRG